MSHSAVEEHPLDPYTFGSEQLCFGCGPHNDRGLKMRFWRRGDEVITRFVPVAGHDGPPGCLHGGLQATMADELAGWTLVGLKGRMGLTTSLNARYMRPLKLGEEVLGRGAIISEEGDVVVIRVILEQGGRTAFRSRVNFNLIAADRLDEMLEGRLPVSWRPFFGG